MLLAFRSRRCLSCRRAIPSRRGVTVLEVLFAIGIVIVGLLGIASLLPLAGHQASESARAAESQALAQDWYAELYSRRLHQSSNWIYYQDVANPPALTPAYAPFTANTLPQVKGGTPPCLFPRVIAKQAVCIDPVFFAEADMRSATFALKGFTQPASANDFWYRPAVFPYYQDRYNPTMDPAYPLSNSSSGAWGETPRMVRVTFPINANTLRPANAKFVEQVFASQDELAMQLEQGDASVPPVRVPTLFGVAGSSASRLPIARSATQTDYSWIATMCPNETLNDEFVDYATLSLVVIYKRDRLFFDDTNIATLPTPRTGAPTPEGKPTGERMAWVVPISGDFTGGTGGRVRLIGTDGVPDKLRIGDWVMLSKYVAANASGIHPVFRWFRVVACNDAEYANLNDPVKDFTVQNSVGRVPVKNFTAGNFDKDPFGNLPPNGDNVWARDVVLEGPDWDFSIQVSGVPTPTTATIVSGTVAVIERIVEMK